MTIAAFITSLKSLLPEIHWPWTFAALSFDPLVWASLGAGPEASLGMRLLNRKSSRPEDYSPAALALLALEMEAAPESLRASPPLEIKLAQIKAESPLAQAGLVALQLREAHRKNVSWDALLRQNKLVSPTSLACLFAIIPDTAEMLRAAYSLDLDGAANQVSNPALHALLSNPLPPAAHQEALYELLSDLPRSERLVLLQQLQRFRPDLAPPLAQATLNLEPPYLGNLPAPVDHSQMINQIEKSLRTARLHRLANDPAQALSSLEAATLSARRVQAELKAQAAQISASSGETQACLDAWEQASQLDPESLDHLSGLTLALLDAGRSSEAQSRLTEAPSHDGHPALSFASARLALLNKDRENARQSALAALEALESGTECPAFTSASGRGYELANLILQLNLPSQAERAAELALKQNPQHADLLALLARARLMTHQPEEAVLAAHLAAALLPENLEIRRLLAQSLEVAGDWQSALKERMALLERAGAPTLDDLRLLATCAIHADEPKQAIQYCQQLLAQDEGDAMALTLLGKATAELGNREAALDHLLRASQLASEMAEPWLALAQLYSEMGQSQKSLETLQAASLAAPDLPEIHLALGEAHLKEGAPTQALSAFRNAANLVENAQASAPAESDPHQDYVHPGSLVSQINLRLGQTLHRLGHLAEAHQTLEAAYRQFPEDTEIAQSFAQVLLAQGEIHAALAPLATVIKSEPAESAPYLDYGRSVLKLHANEVENIPLQEAVGAIRCAQQIDLCNPEITALLAEALAATDELLPAMDAYRKALESSLSQDLRWLSRLSLGMGEVAHKLGQIETAIAALQEAAQADPQNPQIQRSLSEAYDSAGFSQDAYQGAQTAMLLDPNNVNNLTWFASQVLSLQDRPGLHLPDAQNQAIQALDKASQLAEQRGDIWVKLGQIRLQTGDRAGALNAFLELAKTDSPAAVNSSAHTLYDAAQGLVELGQAGAAVRCLEKALQSGPEANSTFSPCLLDLLTALSAARSQAGDIHEALQVLDQAIDLDPAEPSLYLEKADLLLEQSQSEADPALAQEKAEQALACLESAMRLSPTDSDLHQRAALIQRAAGRLPMALAHADQMVEMSTSYSQAMRARALAADLALGMLQPALARTYLDAPLPQPEPGEAADDSTRMNYYTLRTELALEAGDERGAVEELVHVLEIAPDDPRLLAVQARIIYLRDDALSAAEVLGNVIKAIGDPGKASTALLRTAAQAALDVGQWEVSVQLCEQVKTAAPLEPRSHADLARALVLRAEFYRLCLGLDAIRRAADPGALSEAQYDALQQALSKAEEQIKSWSSQPLPLVENSQAEEMTSRPKTKWADSLALIQRWRVRGKAAYQPSAETAQVLTTLPSHPDEAAARVACLRQVGDLSGAGIAARDYPQHPLVLLQLAMALENEKPRQAMAAIHAAADALVQPSASRKFRSAFGVREVSPLIHVLMARLFLHNGNRASDRESALQSALNAVSLWRDEPRWQALAAEIYLTGEPADNQNDLEAAISHLEQAVRLDPGYSPSLIILGQIYLREGSLKKAVQAFEQASEAATETVEPFIWLAQAYRSMGDLEQAAAHAEHAVTLAPNQIEPLLLRGEIALQANNPRGAQSRAQAALRIQPDHPEALLLLARTLNALDRPEEALATLEKALPLTAERLPLSLERVRLLRRARSLETALQAIQTLADHYPEEPTVLALQTELLEADGQSEAAIRTAQRALRSQGGAYPLTNTDLANLHFLLGRTLRRAGQLDQAVHHLSETIRLAPELVDAYIEMGYVHQERRQHSLALAVYRQAISVAPRDYRAYHLVGVALKESKDYLGAEKMLRRAAELAPNDVSIHRMLGAVVALNLVHNRRESTRETI